MYAGSGNGAMNKWGNISSDSAKSTWSLSLGHLANYALYATNLIHTNEDTYIYKYYPDTNYGTENYCTISPANTTIERTLLGFDISGITITDYESVKLLVYAYGIATVYIKRITGIWTETGVTWNNQPAVTDVNFTSYYFPVDSYGWHEIDITALAHDEAGTKLSVELRHSNEGGSGNQINIISKNHPSGIAYSAYLLLGTTADRYVDIATGSDSDDGLSWTNAYLTIKKGIDNLPAGHLLHIAFGNYSAQSAIILNKNMILKCENNGGGGAGTVVLPPTV